MTGPRQRRDERVLALVQRVGLQRGREVVARANSARASMTSTSTAPGRERALADRLLIAVGQLADVDRARDDLDAPLLAIQRTATEVSRPPEYASTTRLALHDLGSFLLLVSAQSPARAASSAATSAPPADSLHDDEHVSSPATVPSTSGSHARSSARADDVRASRAACAARRCWRCGPPRRRTRPSTAAGGRRTGPAPWRSRGWRTPSRRPGCAPSPRRAPRGRGSPSPASRRCPRPRASARAGPGSTPAAPRGCREMRCWRCGLPRVDITDRSRTESASSAPRRVHPVRRLLPDERLRAVDHLGRDLLAPVRGQAVHEHRVVGRGASSARRRRSSRRTRAPARSASSSWPIDVHTSVYTTSAPRTASYGSVVELDRATEVAGPVDDARRRARSPAATRRRARHPRARPRTRATPATLLPSPTNTTRRPSRSPKCSRIVKRSASAWHGMRPSESRLTTGTSTAATIRSSVSCSNTRAAITAHMPAIVRATSSTDLAHVDADLLAAHVDRVAAQRRDRHLDRDPRAGRRLLEQQRDPFARQHGRDPCRVHLPLDRRGRGSPASRAGSRSSTSRRSVVGHASARLAGPREDRNRGVDLGVGDEQRRREPQRARRHRVDDQPAVEARRATTLALGPGASSAAISSPAPADVGDAVELPSASASRLPAARPRAGHVFGFHDVEHRERGARGQRLATERRGVIAGRERGGDVGPRPARADRHAVAERLRHRDDVGAHPGVLEAEPLRRCARGRSAPRP